MCPKFYIPTRRVRRYIQLALTGAALGTIGITIPSRADDVHVNNTNASGPGSLAQAITEGGHIVFDSPLTNGTQFTSPLPNITNSLTIDSTSGLNSFTVSSGLTLDFSSAFDGQLALIGDGNEGAYSITSDLTAKSGIIGIADAYTVNGNLAAGGDYGDLAIISVVSSAVNGTTIKASNGGIVLVSNGSTVTLSGDVTADTADTVSGFSLPNVVVTASSLSAANLQVSNGGNISVESSSAVLTGDATADGVGSNGISSEIDLADGSTLTANNLVATDGGYVDAYGATVTLSGDVLADGIASTGESSKVDIVDGSALTATNLKATNGGIIGVGVFDEDNPMTSSATVGLTGDVLADGVGSNGESSEIDIVDGSALTATNFKSTNGGVIELGVYNSDDLATYSSPATATLTGDVLANGIGNSGARSTIGVYNGSTLTAANLTATDGGYVQVYGATVTLSGDANADGMGSNGVRSEIAIAGGSTLNGNAIATNGGSLYLGEEIFKGGSGVTITGNVTINANSILRSSGFDFLDLIDSSNHLNTDGGTTSFNADSIFAPSVILSLLPNNLPNDLANSVNVDHLAVSDTAKIQPYFGFDLIPLGDTPVGSQYGVSVLKYNSITGTFDSNVASPLDLGVEYADSSGNQTDTPVSGPGQVQLYLNSNQVDFNKLPGSDNAHSLGSFLNRVINDSNTDLGTFTLSNLPTQLHDLALGYITDASFDGNLGSLNDGLPTNYSSFNTQTYWNQKSFVDSVLANLNNDSNMKGAAPSFALNQVSNAGGTAVQLAALRQATSPGFNRLNYADGNGGNSNGVWATYNGNHQHTDGDSGIGSTDWSSSANGFTLGYTGGSDNFSWGAAVGHQKSTLNFNDLGANGEQRGWNSGLYASWKGKSTYLTGVLSYGNFDNDSSDSFGDTSFKTKATSATLELGKHLGNSKSGGLTPYASVLWTRIKQEDVSLPGNPLGLTLKSGSNNVFATQLGVRFNHRMYDKNDTLKGGWQAGAAWLHQGGNTGLPVNASSTFAPGAGTFAVKNTPLAGNSLLVQLGAYGRIHGNLIGFAGYQGTFGSSQKINAVNAGVGYQF